MKVKFGVKERTSDGHILLDRCHVAHMLAINQKSTQPIRCAGNTPTFDIRRCRKATMQEGTNPEHVKL